MRSILLLSIVSQEDIDEASDIVDWVVDDSDGDGSDCILLLDMFIPELSGESEKRYGFRLPFGVGVTAAGIVHCWIGYFQFRLRHLVLCPFDFVEMSIVVDFGYVFFVMLLSCCLMLLVLFFVYLFSLVIFLGV